MKISKKSIVLLLVIFLTVNSVFAFGQKDNSSSSSGSSSSSSSSSSNSSVSISNMQTSISYGSWNCLVTDYNETSERERMEVEHTISYTNSVSPSTGVSLKVIEASVGFTDSSTVEFRINRSIEIPPKQKMSFYVRPKYTNFRVYSSSSLIGTARKVSGCEGKFEQGNL